LGVATLTSLTTAPSASTRRGRAPEVERLLADLRRLVEEGHELERRGGDDARRANRRAAERVRWQIARAVRNDITDPLFVRGGLG
jgi:hypothetical protein